MAAALSVIGTFASCDTSIDVADRLIEENDTVSLADGKNVLVVDFTGQQCVNCPPANDEIHAMQQAYGSDRVVAVAMHSGPLGFRTRGRYLGLATDEGDNYYNQWKIDAQPMGIIDYQGPYSYDGWTAIVREHLKQSKAVDIAVANSSVGDGTLSGTVSLTSLRGEVDGRLQLWLLEDSIQAIQMLPDGGRDLAYMHRHVYRKSINATDGQLVSVSEGSTRTVDFSTALSPDWRTNQLWIVAFVYNNDGVMQVVQKKVTNNE